jgi:hypothetical protein
MWLANFSDGSTKSSKQTFWNQLPKDSKMTGLQLSHPYLPKLWICLNGYDRYYFTQEAIATMNGTQSVSVVAEIVGAHDLKLGVAVEVRLARTGNVNVRTYPISAFKYSPEILHDGNRKPGVAASAEVSENQQISA